MKVADKVALVGLGLGALGVIFYKHLMGRGFDRPKNISPEEEKRLQKRFAQGPAPAVMRTSDGRVVRVAPDGSIMGPVIGTAQNMRGHYG